MGNDDRKRIERERKAGTVSAAPSRRRGGGPGVRRLTAGSHDARRRPGLGGDSIEARVGRIAVVDSAELSGRQLAVIGELLRRRALRSRGQADRRTERRG
jgi:hypothetical protein